MKCQPLDFLAGDIANNHRVRAILQFLFRPIVAAEVEMLSVEIEAHSAIETVVEIDFHVCAAVPFVKSKTKKRNRHEDQASDRETRSDECRRALRLHRLQLRASTEWPPASAGAPFRFRELIAEVLLAFADLAEKVFVRRVLRLEREQLLIRIQRVVPARQLHLRAAEKVKRAALAALLCRGALQNRNRLLVTLHLIQEPSVSVRGGRILRLGFVRALVHRQRTIPVAAVDGELRIENRQLHVLRKQARRRFQLALRVSAHLPPDERADQLDVWLGIAGRSLDRVAQRRERFLQFFRELLQRKPVMTTASRTVVENAVFGDGNERDVDDAKPFARVVGRDRRRAAALLTDIDVRRAVTSAVIARTDSIERERHGTLP